MADYSGVTLDVSLQHYATVKDEIARLDLGPTDSSTPRRDALGRGLGPCRFHWEEMRSGLDNEAFLDLCDFMRQKRIPYSARDDGCWGVWNEEQEIHLDGNVGRRYTIDLDPAMNRSLYAAAKKSLSGEELLEWVDAYFSDDPKGWVW